MRGRSLPWPGHDHHMRVDIWVDTAHIYPLKMLAFLLPRDSGNSWLVARQGPVSGREAASVQHFP